MKSKSFGLALCVSVILGIGLNLLPHGAAATMDTKIPCHSSSTASTQNTYTMCSTCTSTSGIGSDAGQCRTNNSLAN